MNKYKINSFKSTLFIAVFAMFIVTNVSHIAVYAIESKYSFIWLWASKSPAKVYHLYYITFLLNWLVCTIFLSILVFLSKSLQKTILRLFWVLVIPIIVLTIRALAGFIIFDLELYPYEPLSYVENSDISSEYNNVIYCDYWVLGVNSDYGNPELCGRPN